MPPLQRNSVVVDEVAPIGVVEEHFGDPEGAVDVCPLEIRGALHSAALLSTQNTRLAMEFCQHGYGVLRARLAFFAVPISLGNMINWRVTPDSKVVLSGLP